MSLVLMSFVLAFGGGSPEEVAPPSSRVVLCRPNVPKQLMEGSATFSLIYEAKFDDAGLLQELTERKGFKGVDSIRACVSEWRMPGSAAGQSVSIVLRWEHGKGWVSMALKSPTLGLTLVDASPCDYLRARSETGSSKAAPP